MTEAKTGGAPGLPRRYVLRGKLGAGGMGSIHRAWDSENRREVAIKVLKREFAADEGLRKRFIREAVVLASIDHPNVVELYDIGRNSNPPWFVEELLLGDDLGSLLWRGERLDEDDAWQVAVDLSSALAALHGAGLVHRDVKPGNLFITDDGVTKLLDFGLVLDEQMTRLTRAGSIVGTYTYVAPEVIRGHAATPAADVYQVGLLLHEVLTGRLLDRNPELGLELIAIVGSADFTPPEPDPSIRADLAEFIRTCCQAAPEDRPANGEALSAVITELRQRPAFIHLSHDGLPIEDDTEDFTLSDTAAVAEVSRGQLLAAVCGLISLFIAILALVAYLWATAPLPELAVPASGGQLANVTLIEPERFRKVGMLLTFSHEKIERVVPARHEDRQGPYAGMYVMPGFTDMYVHLPSLRDGNTLATHLLLYLAHGVTTVRQAAAADGAHRHLDRAIGRGERAGPQVYAIGAIDIGRDCTAQLARHFEDDVLAVEASSETRPSTAALTQLHEAAWVTGISVVGSVSPRSSVAERKVREVVHRYLPAEPWQAADLSSLRHRWSTRSTTVAHIPRLVLGATIGTIDHAERLGQATWAGDIPPHYREVWWRPAVDRLLRPWTKQQRMACAQGLSVQYQFVRQLHEAGAPMFIGTSAGRPFVVPGHSFHEELRHLQAAGLPLERMLAMATTLPAMVLPREQHGQLSPGSPANLLVFRDDPTRSLDALSSLVAVVARGRLYQREDMEQVRAARRHAQQHWLRRVVLTVAARLAALFH